MKPKEVLVTLVLAALFLAGCGQDPTVQVTVYVNDEQGILVDGAYVSVYSNYSLGTGTEKFTELDGTITATGTTKNGAVTLNLIPGNYAFIATKGQARGDEEKLVINKENNVYIKMAPWGIACENECAESGAKQCSANNAQACGNYDEDICLEWKNTTCMEGQVCRQGECIQQAEMCNQAAYKMAFVLLGETQAELNEERLGKLNSIKDSFSSQFNLATYGLATMDTNYPVAKISRSELPEYTMAAISKKFYETHPDTFDFISVFAVNGAGSPRQTSYERAQNRVRGLGVGLNDWSAEFGSGGKLLGVIYERDIDIISEPQNSNLLHETGHQWCCYAGENFTPSGGGLGIIQESIHFFRGLESPYQCGDPMGAKYWMPNGDGTYKQNKDCQGPMKYHPFELYFMGLYTEDNFDFDRKFRIFYAESEMESHATEHHQTSINDIITLEGPRACAAPEEAGTGPKPAQT